MYIGLVPEIKDQKDPVINQHPGMWDKVIEDIKDSYKGHPIQDIIIKDMIERDRIGQERYHTKLQPFNGRDALVDAVQEFYDGAVYLKQKIYELLADGKDATQLQVVYWLHLDNLMSVRQQYITLSSNK